MWSGEGAEAGPRESGGRLCQWGEAVYSVISLMIRHGFPAANTPAGMSLVTTLPAPITVFGPIFTPGQMIAPPPTHTSEPILMGLPNSCFLRSSAFIGCMGV